ncbi:D-aspartate oxidase 2 [Parelaphostrongylus tenuis]|uniref:D-aspartate oxidase 2 n=1 Tax=Parelaphostrongylus tenuis TaxID=148309 RepID=A0AAD5QR26_PARTN|nr:D-aspartate oxidase 2 [Parelaphostrongylus tenuis]
MIDRSKKRVQRCQQDYFASMTWRIERMQRQHLIGTLKLCRNLPGSLTGVKLLSGHIQSDSKEALAAQERAYGDIVCNFRYMSDQERQILFADPSKHAIHFSSFAAEGNRYVPFLKNQLRDSGVVFTQRTLQSASELADDGYDVIVNSAGLNAGKLAGDDDSVYPIRGVVFEVDAPWHKHFNYRDFETFTIPKNDCVVVGTVKQANRHDTEITDEDRRDIWQALREAAADNEKCKNHWRMV